MDLESRARVHAALGDPIRLAAVDALLHGDRTPRQLSDLLVVPPNLLSHHLDVLVAAGLLERRVSAGDRRRRYLVLRPEALEHLRPGRAGEVGRIVFVCTHNSARSQFAAGLWRQRTGSDAESAGSHPAERLHPEAVRVAAARGLDLTGATPRSYAEVATTPDTVVSVCDRAAEGHIPFPGRRIHWSVPDPVGSEVPKAFELAFDEIVRRVESLAARGRSAPDPVGEERG